MRISDLPMAPSATRLLLAALAMTLFGLVICGFLQAILEAAGDHSGRAAYSAIAMGLTGLAAAECFALVITVAIRMESGGVEQSPRPSQVS